MATSEEARQAIIDQIEEYAPNASPEGLKYLAEAWEIVRKREGGRAIVG